ncbi:MAG: histidine phosphatase family protein [Alphaproteobacteria bacterium]|nr:histidine phosphatase family protein [Alphaproteobacteria bacterium]
MTKLILARHGNTFRPEDTPVWVGARTDMPLVEKGLTQAHDLAEALKRSRLVIDSILTGPLQRTLATAKIIGNKLGMADKVRIDPRLTEIDYGAWEGKACEQIDALGHTAEREAWEKSSVYPASPGFAPAEPQIIADVQAILNERSSGKGLVVTSNGILRYFARAALNAADFPSFKVATGAVCVMERTPEGWRIGQWNKPPSVLTEG